MKKAKIGKINIHYVGMETGVYLDTSETYLHGFFDLPQSKKVTEIINILSNYPSWPILYHLSPQREALLNWYPFESSGTLLEVGAGCGALTGLFSRKVKKVVANELTPARGEIIARRYCDQDNIEIYIGDFLNSTTSQKFDYITVIGVLEYAGKYSSSNTVNPFLSFLQKVRKMLGKKGHLLLAIENKLGVKYISGGKEDHYGNLFSSLENYPQYKGVRTFSKNELIGLLKNAGFGIIDFYYPYPDYKLPYSILSEKGFGLNLSKSSLFKTRDISNPPMELFNDILFSNELLKEGIISHFANSFLIDATI